VTAEPTNWRQRSATIAFLVVATTVAVLSVMVYRDPRLSALAILTVSIGVVGFAAIDFYVRPSSRLAPKRWYRKYLPAWCFLPFFGVLAGSSWIHYQCWQEGLDDIHEVARDLSSAVLVMQSGTAWGPANAPGTTAHVPTIEEIDATVVAIVDKRYPGTPKPAEANRLTELALVIGHDLRRYGGNPVRVRDRAERDTTSSFALAMAAQALFVLWIPVLLAVAIARAGQKLLEGIDGPAGMSARDNRILAENQALFVPRFCFGALLVLGTNYVFAPLGLKATYLMSLVDVHAPPGHPTWTLWSTSFSEVPPIVVGFVGFLLYALITATQRYAQDDLDDVAMLALLVRGLVVVLLGLALSSADTNPTAARLMVFVAGVFPIRALEAIAKKVNVSIDPDFDEPPKSFEGLASLDPTKVFALRSAGIQSAYDLAAMPIDEIARRVRIDPRLLGRAVDRAILIDAIGLDMVKKLEPFAINSASELADLAGNIPGPVSTSLGDGPARVAEILKRDPRVDQVRLWLAGASPDAKAKAIRVALDRDAQRP